MSNPAHPNREKEEGINLPDRKSLAMNLASEEPQPASARSAGETIPPRPVAAAHNGRRTAAATPKESKVLWQTADAAARAAQAPTGVRSAYPPRTRTNGGRQKLMMALIPVLAVVLITLLKNPLGIPHAAKANATSSRASEQQGNAGVEITWEIPAPFLSGGRDPMQLTPPPARPGGRVPEAAARPTEDAGALVVTGILYSEDRPLAIINTQIVHEGQQIAGATVDKIDRDGVRFERNGRKWKQGLNP